MASLRRVKVLLVLNLIAVAGFVLFLAKCRPIAVRSGDAFHEIRPRAEVANLSVHSASPIQDAVLKRLSLLEDIVYRQLNAPGSLRAARGASWSQHLLAPARSLLPFLPRLGQTAGGNGLRAHRLVGDQ
ncbi:Polypeptide N-acetylgalactosaminyltransferase 17 [Saguinus oedipus]|uniref:Polypeptide N-acetylgalactosaminyltransferase 17 n=1 Tax=Saguinus oedipus TaxID=9490 RepID=A0ABQ9W7J4_SAGOE|nr:Polypeptide N-acetylgalactosaminyltransferase 17 [Saguinus oedipus]